MIATAADRSTIASRWSDDRVVVVVLCAAWCDTCTEFRAIDVENFPTLAIYRGATLLHYGISLPQEGAVARLLDEMAGRQDAVRDAPEPVLALPNALR